MWFQYWLQMWHCFEIIKCFCAAVQCSAPSNKPNTAPVPAEMKFVYTSSYTYGCKYGYKPSGDMTVTCESDGSWSCLTATCIGLYHTVGLYGVLTNWIVTSGSRSWIFL